MKRTYNPEARKALIKLLRNAIKAVERGQVNDSNDIGGICHFLSYFAVACEDPHESEDTELSVIECIYEWDCEAEAKLTGTLLKGLYEQLGYESEEEEPSIPIEAATA